MEEIEFRGKGVEGIYTGKFVYGDLKRFATNEVAICELANYGDSISIGLKTWLIDPETVGQYTGRNDKNNTKIYNHDIIRAYGKYIGKIVYKLGGFVFETVDGNITFLGMISPLDIECLGNIHDTPEWLEKV
jgi:uncharacterized phage protein (TIGR01671 family)